ncbi:MAG: hypothetical protein HQL01_05965 [Nitrospirae bacterium]|nr:hypothetical protein [Nitrospirota bacterium]
MSVFYNNGKGYKENIIRECLGSLSDAPCSNMIRVNRAVSYDLQHVQIANLTLNERGKHCLKHVFDRFFYMQLIVDDFLLPIPRIKIIEETFNVQTEPIDYRYVVLPVDKYMKHARKMVHKKAFKVLYFMQILKASLKIEQICYPGVFENLTTTNVEIPDPIGIEHGIINELRILNSVFNDLFDVNTIVNRAHSIYDDIYSYLLKAYTAGIKYNNDNNK